ncbi:PREDICTED: uncharacterized protein LOC102015749 [Chinchilla lanigera]|uniref:uncharacterized protein LOC102015749 n=1 Tax=Chinchilla lanigera TaxID=34839 RepID=UPI0006990DD0|nr:PREDICTED: uncharacterized protein LOC102015749 [Chinchilla lanigera]
MVLGPGCTTDQSGGTAGRWRQQLQREVKTRGPESQNAVPLGSQLYSRAPPFPLVSSGGGGGGRAQGCGSELSSWLRLTGGAVDPGKQAEARRGLGPPSSLRGPGDSRAGGGERGRGGAGRRSRRWGEARGWRRREHEWRVPSAGRQPDDRAAGVAAWRCGGSGWPAGKADGQVVRRTGFQRTQIHRAAVRSADKQQETQGDRSREGGARG